MHNFSAQLLRLYYIGNLVIVLVEFHDDETPLLSWETPLFFSSSR
jgi:hypothetical protein